MEKEIKDGTPPVEATSGDSLRSSEYPLRALVAVAYYKGAPRGTIIAAKADEYGGGYTSHDPNSRKPFEWLGSDLIIDPTPEQIAEERAKLSPAAEAAPEASEGSLIEAATEIRDVLGFAEWATPEHAEIILQELIQHRLPKLRAALSKVSNHG